MAAVALALYLLGLVVLFGVRCWVHHRRTGSSGFKGISGAPGSVEWWGGVLLVAAVMLDRRRCSRLATDHRAGRSGCRVRGHRRCSVGHGGIVAHRGRRGGADRAGHRRGVRLGSQPDLLRHGRLPDWGRGDGPVACQRGVGCRAHRGCAGSGPRVEEPYLYRTHGDAYRTYCARTGRFVPRRWWAGAARS